MAALGADAIGVIAVPQSPRWLEPQLRPALFAAVRGASSTCFGVLVVADPADGELDALGPAAGHQVLQLHGAETPQRCAELRQALGPDLKLWKALRIRSEADLAQAQAYAPVVDALLLDAWVPDQLGVRATASRSIGSLRFSPRCPGGWLGASRLSGFPRLSPP